MLRRESRAHCSALRRRRGLVVARRDRRVARRLKRVDNRRMEYLRALFGPLSRDADDAEVRCLLFYSLWIGSHFVAADHPGKSRSEVVKLALERLERP